MIPFSESDGIGASFQRRVCAWCSKDLGVQVCAPSEAGEISHGMCEACAKGQRDELLSGLGNNEAASALANSSPEPSPARVTGTSAPVAQAAAALEHLSRGPAASSTFSPPHWTRFWLVSGADFRRSIDWAKAHGNPISDKITAIKRSTYKHEN